MALSRDCSWLEPLPSILGGCEVNTSGGNICEVFGRGVAAVGGGGQGWMREDELALAGDEGLVRALRFGRCGLVRWSRLLFVARQERVEMTMRAVGCVRAKPSLLIGVNCYIVKGRAGQGKRDIIPALLYCCRRRGCLLPNGGCGFTPP